MMKESTMHMIIVAILLVAVVILGKVAYDKMQKNKEEKKDEPAEYYRYNKFIMNQTQRMPPINYYMDRSWGGLEIPSATPSKENFSLGFIENISKKSAM